MQAIELSSALSFYNPWWASKRFELAHVPTYTRRVFRDVYRDVRETRQIFAIAGPRQVGKTTMVRQVIRDLLASGTDASHLLYFSMDDPIVLSADDPMLFDRLIEYYETYILKAGIRDAGSTVYFFLDEIHRYHGWEAHLKKYYDAGLPIKFVISGSASSPLIKGANESLVGRSKKYRVAPFSFLEYLLLRNERNTELVELLTKSAEIGKEVFSADFDPDVAARDIALFERDSHLFAPEIKSALRAYFVEGGFPEVWTLRDHMEKYTYLYDNMVRKVVYEDLVYVAGAQNPDRVAKLFLHIVQNLGQEISVPKLAQDADVDAQFITKYLPYLELSHLVHQVEKFDRKPLRMKKGNSKYYLYDLGLRNAITRMTEEGLWSDGSVLGFSAENLVLNNLRARSEVRQVSYYREGRREVDFVAHMPTSVIPVEVKFQNSLRAEDYRGLVAFKAENASGGGILIARDAPAASEAGTLTLRLATYLIVTG